ncbi:MAG: endolytic transglycosylase MltG [Saprospiraceae bacterium]|nr:endolytic transglycosylase MltG [Saprospiraceae bacterium]
MPRIPKKIFIVIVFIILIMFILAYYLLHPLFETAIKNEKENPYILFIPPGSGFDDVFQILTRDSVLQNPSGFIKSAKLLKYKKEEVPPGKYIFNNTQSTKEVISKLRSGNQDPVNVVVNNVRTIEDLAGKIDEYFEVDSLTILEYFKQPEIQQEYKVNDETLMTLFIPNTYQMFWTTKPEKLLERMKKEHDKFWTQANLDKIKKWNLSPIQAYTLASIVEKESNYKPERPAIAGVYLNRIQQGMKLQADPTVVFATGQYDLKRVLYSHLEYDSPYNTYMYEGIPPGPIYMPSISSLEAVINAEKHNYIFFCAKADNSGQHVFASTLQEHNKNAELFSNWLNSIGIK